MYIIGIAGGSGSGKTTFAHKVLAHTKQKAVIIHMDSYYLPQEYIKSKTASGQVNFDHPDAFDWDLLRSHIKLLREGHTIEVPVYDFKTSSRLEKTTKLVPSKVILLEGIFALYDNDVREMLDIMCFLHVDSDIRFIRRLHRDVQERGRSLESVIKQYYETVRPMYQKYLGPQKEFAHFIVGEETDVASSILASKIHGLLNEVNPTREEEPLTRPFI